MEPKRCEPAESLSLPPLSNHQERALYRRAFLFPTHEPLIKLIKFQLIPKKIIDEESRTPSKEIPSTHGEAKEHARKEEDLPSQTEERNADAWTEIEKQ